MKSLTITTIVTVAPDDVREPLITFRGTPIGDKTSSTTVCLQRPIVVLTRAYDKYLIKTELSHEVVSSIRRSLMLEEFPNVQEE